MSLRGLESSARWVGLAALVTLPACFSRATGGSGNDGGPGSIADGGCQTGSSGCDCYGNETCDGPLTCVSGRCAEIETVVEDASVALMDAAGGGAGNADAGNDADAGMIDGDGGGGGACAAGAADMIWVLDNSCSMAVEAAAVQEGMNGFAAALTDRGVDVNVVLISSAMVAADCACAPNDFVCALNCLTMTMYFGACIDAPFGSGMCPDDSRPPSFLHLDVPVGSTDALQLVLSEYPNYAHMMRSGASKHFFVVSDDNSAMDAATFTAGVEALDPTLFDDWTFHGVYSLTLCTDAAAVGAVYDELVAQTMGVSGDLCLQSFPPVFDAIVEAVANEAAGGCP